MVASEIILKIPYSIAWRIANINNYSFPVVFYCADYLDYVVFAPIKKYLPYITIVAMNSTVQELLFEKGISSILPPVYPKVVLMARHAHHKFPSSKVIKIGMRHGAFNFKNFIKASQYNRFGLFLFTSNYELKKAKEIGINSGVAIGFPKIDNLHNDSISINKLNEFKNQINLDSSKPSIMFTATWNKSGLSAIDKWYDQLAKLTKEYNVLVTTHHFTDKKYVDIIKRTDDIHFIVDSDISKYLLLADVLVGDSSSIIAEFCSLNKPIVTFRIPQKGRINPEIIIMLDEISFRINSFNELIEILPSVLVNKQLHSESRMKYNSVMFDNLDGSAGKRAANEIVKFMKNEEISF